MTSRHSVTCQLLVVAALTSACTEAERAPTAALVRDSAGITIVENGEPGSSSATEWHVADPPLVEIGGLDDEPGHQLNQVRGAVQLPDGHIVVADAGSRELRFFDASGGHLLTAGGAGGGPGEMRLLRSLDRLHGDTLVASSLPVGVDAWFDTDGQFLFNMLEPQFGPGLLGRRMADGSLLVDVYEMRSYGNEVEMWAGRGQEPRFRPHGTVLHVSRNGERTDTILEVDGEEFFKIGQPGAGLFVRTMPFTARTLFAWTEDRLYVGLIGDNEVRVYGLGGDLRRIIRWDQPPAPVTAADRDDFRKLAHNTLNRPERRPGLERWLADVEFPETKPPVRALQTDRDGRLWVQQWPQGRNAGEQWLVFDADGQFVAHVDTPPALTPLEIGPDYFLGLWKDEFDVEYVRLYGLAK